MKGIRKPALALQGFQAIPGVYGPLGKSVDDCILFFRSLWNSSLYGQVAPQD